MPFHQKVTWILTCAECGAHTDIGVRPAHLSAYTCKKCQRADTFVYPAQVETVSETRAIGPPRWWRSKMFWEGVLNNVLAALIVAAILGAAAYFAGVAAVRDIVRDEIERARQAEPKGQDK